MADNSNSTKDWTVIKGKIFTPKHNFYGLIVVFFDNNTNTVENLSLVFSIYSETHDLSLDDTWDKFEKKIQDMIYGGNLSKTVTMSTADKLKADMSLASFGRELKDSIVKNEISLINKQFLHTLARNVNDPGVTFECAAEQITSDELSKGRIRDMSSADKTEPDPDLPADYRLVRAKLIVAPVNGKLITDLREGDSILLNLIAVSMTENYILDKFKARKPDGSGKPVPAKIVKIKSLPKGWQLLVHFTEKYYAKITEEEKIMVKTSGATDSSPSKITQATNKSSGHKSFFSWVAVAIVILLAMTIAYFVFLGG